MNSQNLDLIFRLGVVSTTPVEPGMTNEEILADFAHLVGTAYSESMRLDIAQKTGRDVRRSGIFLVTQGQKPDRLNIRINDDGIISGFLFC
jgi:hypothetical protein